jgi:hypothetical protein
VSARLDRGAWAGPGGGLLDLDRASEAELAAAVSQIAELAQLGAGSVAQQFPRSLEEFYEACQDELPFRVAL